MHEKVIFRELLNEIKILADEKGNSLTIAEIDDFFANAHLDEAQLGMVYEYLRGQKINIVGYQGEDTADVVTAEAEPSAEPIPPSEPNVPAEDDYVRIYLEELESLAKMSEEEETQLFDQARKGSKEAKNRLVERYLPLVAEVAHTYLIGDLPLGDLIQEGNIALLLAMEELAQQEDLEAYKQALYRKITGAMEAALEEYHDLKEMDEKIAARVNHLHEAVTNLEQDLEHKVSLDELSAYLEMSEKEIKEILRMAGDEIELL